jgi:transposase InsO family protein
MKSEKLKNLANQVTESIVTDALTLAWFRKKPASGLMHPSDRGSPYASLPFRTSSRRTAGPAR